MKPIQIQVPEGYEVDKFDPSTNEITFKKIVKKDMMDRIKTVQDAIDKLGSNDTEVVNLGELYLVRRSRSSFDPSLSNGFTKLYDRLVAHQEAVVLFRAINEKREPNWNDTSEPKYSLRFIMSGSSGFRFHVCDYWSTYSTVGSRLVVFKPEHVEYLGTQFVEVFKRFMVIEH